MSTPTRQLRDLSLGGMTPTTRSQQKARDKQAGNHQQQTSSEGPSGVVPSIERDDPLSQATPSTPGHLIRGHSGLQYSVQRLSPTSVSRATVGLSSTFEVKGSRSHEDEDKREYQAIQLNQPARVQIFNPAHTDGAYEVSCNCAEYKEEQRRPGTPICIHIYWLYDALNLAFEAGQTNLAKSVTKDGVVRAIIGRYGDIRSEIGMLREMLNQDSQKDLEVDEQMITRDCLDMLSVMTVDLPDEFAKDNNIANIPDEVNELRKLIEPEDMERTIFGLIKHDETLRWQLQRVLTKDYCVQQLLLKLESRADEVFERLAAHVRDGPQSDPQIIARCAQRLRTIVAQCTYYINSRAPLSRKTRCEATKALVKILDEVCQNDDDIYDEITWRRTQADPNQPYNRNLFVNLIGRPPPRGVAGNIYTSEEELFALSAIGDFSRHEMIDCRSSLEDIVGTLKDNEAPRRFIEGVEEIIEDVQDLDVLQDSSPPRSPSAEETRLQHSLPSSPATAEPVSQRRRLA